MSSISNTPSGSDISAAAPFNMCTLIKDHIFGEDEIIIGAKPKPNDTSISLLSVKGRFDDVWIRFWDGGGRTFRMFFMDFVRKESPNETIALPRGWMLTTLSQSRARDIQPARDIYWIPEGMRVRLDYPEHPPFFFEAPSRESAFDLAKPAAVLQVRAGYNYPTGNSVIDTAV